MTGDVENHNSEGSNRPPSGELEDLTSDRFIELMVVFKYIQEKLSAFQSLEVNELEFRASVELLTNDLTECFIEVELADLHPS